jgi:simple sugar transport system substrate-binding protein
LIIEAAGGHTPFRHAFDERLWEEIMMSLTKKTHGRCGVRGTGFWPAPAQAEGERYVLVSHAPDSDSWWNTIKNGIALAGEQMGVEVEYRNPPTGDLADMARIIEQAAASSPDGIITTLADYDVLSGPIKAAVDSGIDVIIMNSGTPEQAREVGALMYVGQPEYDAGYAAGLRAKGRRRRLVPMRQPLHLLALLDRALPGLRRWPGRRAGQPDDRQRAGPGRDQEPRLAYLNSNPDTDAVLTLGPTSADPTMLALEENGMAGDIYFGTFDLGDNIVKASRRRHHQVGHRPAALPAGLPAGRGDDQLPPLRRAAGQQHQLRPRLRDRRRARDGGAVRGRIPLI